MEFSDTKHVCIASSARLAALVVARTPGLNIRVARSAKSLGGALGAGKIRCTKVLRKRLAAFKVRKARFQKFRRMMGADACHRVLRTGGTAAMVFGQGNTGVSCSSLYAQRSSVGAAASPGGSGDLDLTLVLADGSLSGTADPVHAAHLQPIVKWAHAVWDSWLPFCALSRICSTAISELDNCARPWSRVVGLGWPSWPLHSGLAGPSSMPGTSSMRRVSSCASDGTRLPSSAPLSRGQRGGGDGEGWKISIPI